MSNPESLIDSIRHGGPLAKLFQQASTQVRRAIEDALSHGWASQVVASISRQSHEQLDRGIATSPLNVLRQCSAGCSACCHTVSVDVTPLEAIVVAEYLLQQIPEPRLATIRARLAENAQRRAVMTADERSQVRLKCGLLGDDGLCQAYAARPLVCAGVFSLSRAACEGAAAHADLASQQVPLDRPAKAWTMGISGGLQRALVDAGLDGNLYELNSIVLCALETPRVAARWLEREDIFARCICTDAHSPPRRMPVEQRLDSPHAVVPPPAMLRHARRDAQRSAPRRT